MERINRLYLLLTVRESAMYVPSNIEARRRLSFFLNSLFMDMPSAPKVCNMLSLKTGKGSSEQILGFSHSSEQGELGDTCSERSKPLNTYSKTRNNRRLTTQKLGPLINQETRTGYIKEVGTMLNCLKVGTMFNCLKVGAMLNKSRTIKGLKVETIKRSDQETRIFMLFKTQRPNLTENSDIKTRKQKLRDNKK
ncbi:putative 1,3-beta-glucan synthase [Helianthus annuus]|nr:putative 1,3-beta-glucan synthase [Helianthus annuus]